MLRGGHVQCKYIVSLVACVSFAFLALLSNMFAAAENSSMMVFLLYPVADRRSANCWVISMKSATLVFWSQ